MGKYSLLMVAGFLLVFGIVRRNLNQTNAALMDNYIVQFEQREAKFAAWSVINVALAALREDWDIANAKIDTVDVNGGTAWTDTSSLADDRFVITGYGRVESAVLMRTIEDRVEVIVELPEVPGILNSAITANTTIGVSGGCEIDGRDHNWDGNVISDEGTYAFATHDSLWVSSAAMDIAGTSYPGGNGQDMGPYKSQQWRNDPNHDAWDLVNYLSGPQHLTPDAVLGMGEGDLRAMAITNNRFYTNGNTPPQGDVLTGVTYIEADGDFTLNLGTVEHFGVLVVHNPNGTTRVKPLTGSAVFRGIVILDDLANYSLGNPSGPADGGGVLGAMVCLTTTPQDGHVLGLGNGRVRFSRTTIRRALAQAGGLRVRQWHGQMMVAAQ